MMKRVRERSPHALVNHCTEQCHRCSYILRASRHNAEAGISSSVVGLLVKLRVPVRDPPSKSWDRKEVSRGISSGYGFTHCRRLCTLWRRSFRLSFETLCGALPVQPTRSYRSQWPRFPTQQIFRLNAVCCTSKTSRSPSGKHKLSGSRQCRQKITDKSAEYARASCEKA